VGGGGGGHGIAAVPMAWAISAHVCKAFESRQKFNVSCKTCWIRNRQAVPQRRACQ
jgi:hypothetical protein